MQIIGITGAIGHGKSTLAEAFLKAEPRAIHLESFQIIAEVADALHAKLSTVPAPDDLPAINDWLEHLPAILKKVLHLEVKPLPIQLELGNIEAAPADYEKLFQHLQNLTAQPDLADQLITNDNKTNYRSVLQWLGGYVTTHVDARAWYLEIVRRAQQAGHKGTALAVVGGLRFPNDASVLREAGGIVIKIERPAIAQADLADPTERERAAIQADSLVINNGSLEQLSKVAVNVLNDLRAGSLKPRYETAALRVV